MVRYDTRSVWRTMDTQVDAASAAAQSPVPTVGARRYTRTRIAASSSRLLDNLDLVLGLQTLD